MQEAVDSLIKDGLVEFIEDSEEGDEVYPNTELESLLEEYKDLKGMKEFISFGDFCIYKTLTRLITQI